MSLPAAAAHRTLKHRRTIDVQVFDRGDGTWEVDARLSDVKTRDVVLGGRVRPAGAPLHGLLLRLVVDQRFNILQAGSQSESVPYPGQCERAGDVYQRLVGLNLMRGFRKSLRERIAADAGCTHLTETAQVLPTAVMQAFAGDVYDTGDEPGQRPYPIDRCLAWRSDGEVVKTLFPRWFREPAPSTGKAAGPTDS